MITWLWHIICIFNIHNKTLGNRFNQLLIINLNETKH
jgi:hypothetical protein